MCTPKMSDNIQKAAAICIVGFSLKKGFHISKKYQIYVNPENNYPQAQAVVDQISYPDMALPAG